MKRLFLMALIAAIGLLIGCDSGDDGSSNPPTVDVTGEWQVESGLEGTMNLEQIGASVSGRLTGSSGIANIDGSVSDNSINMTFTFANGDAIVDASVAGGTMNGIVRDERDNSSNTFAATRE